MQISENEDGPWREFSAHTGNVSATSITPGTNNSIIYLRAGFASGNYTSGQVNVTLAYPGGGGDGYCRITGITSTTVAQMVVTRRMHVPSVTSLWSEGRFSSLRGWPSAVALFEGRLWFGGLDQLAGSVSDGFKSFDLNVEGDSGPVLRSIATGAVNSVKWILGLSRLCMGTAGAEPVGRSSSFDEPVTPTNFSIKDASTQGSADIQAVKIDRSAIFVQRSGKRAYDLSYSIDAQDYASQEITRFHPTVLDAGVKLVAVQRQPDTRVWFLLNDGTCAILTHERSEDVLSWYTFGTDGLIEDVAVLPNTGDDDVYLVVNRTINGGTRRYVEKLAYDAQAQGGGTNYMADAYVTADLIASDTVTGLLHLEGEEVIVWADGAAIMDGDEPDTFTVSSGEITLPEAVTGTVIVGLAYDWQWQSSKLAYGVNDGAPLSRRRTLRDVAPILGQDAYRGITHSMNGRTYSRAKRWLALVAAAGTAASAAAPALSTLATAGTALGAAGTVYSGLQAKAGADFEAKQMKARGDEEFAIGQRKAMQARREKELAQSRIQAVAAASGAGVDNDWITSIMEGVEQQGEYNALLELYQGNSARNKAYAGAGARKAEGKSALTGSVLGAAGKAGSNLYSIYGKR